MIVEQSKSIIAEVNKALVGKQDVVEKAFGKKLVDNKVDLPGVVSRKKQIVPQMQTAFEN